MSNTSTDNMHYFRVFRLIVNGFIGCLLASLLGGCMTLNIDVEFPQRSYLTSEAETQRITELAARDLGFRISHSKRGESHTEWKEYEVGTRGWLFFKKNWSARTRLLINIEDATVDAIWNGYGDTVQAATVEIDSETQDSPSRAKRWNTVSRATDEERGLIQDLIDQLDTRMKTSGHKRAF